MMIIQTILYDVYANHIQLKEGVEEYIHALKKQEFEGLTKSDIKLFYTAAQLFEID